MAANAQDASDRALQTRKRRVACGAAALGAAAATGHGAAHANTAVVTVAGGMFAATSALTLLADQTGAPQVVVWIWAAVAGTMAGAFAAVMVSLIMAPRAPWKRHVLHLLLAFVFGLIGAPLAAIAWDPQPPKHVPLAVIWFAISGICGFVAPAFAIALHKRSEGLAENVIDKVTTPQQARDERRNRAEQNDEDERGNQ